MFGVKAASKKTVDIYISFSEHLYFQQAET